MKTMNIYLPKKPRSFLSFAVTVIFVCQLCHGEQRPLSGPALARVKAAAVAGKPAAQDELAWQYVLRGDATQAELLYSRAAQQGYAHAQGKLGEMLLVHVRLDVGLKYSVKKAMVSHAVEWLNLAANQGEKLAQTDLAGMYLNGAFVKTDLVESYKWADLAAKETPSAPGLNNGRSIRERAVRQMSVEQIAEARRRVAAFIPHIPSTTSSLPSATEMF